MTLLLLQGRLAVLNVGTHSPLHHMMLHEGTKPLRTLYEEDFGRSIADLLYFPPGDTTGNPAAAVNGGSPAAAGLSRKQQRQHQQQGRRKKRIQVDAGLPGEGMVRSRQTRTGSSTRVGGMRTGCGGCEGVYVSM